jgi:hypothetical protein
MLSRLFLCRPVHGLVELETAYEVLLPLIIVVWLILAHPAVVIAYKFSDVMYGSICVDQICLVGQWSYRLRADE